MPATFIEIIDRLGGGEPDGDGYVTLCPVHGDTNPSLRLTLKEEGRVLMTCRSHDCAFTDIVAAIGMEPGDFRNVEAGGDVVTSSANGVKAPPTAVQIGWLRDFIGEAADRYADSPAAEYANQRWGITETQAARLKLGYTDEASIGDFIPYPWTTVPRVVVPLDGFDGVPRGAQGRALEDDPAKWCSLLNPPDNAWARLGVFSHETGDDYTQLGEGPGDALTAYAAGTPAVFLRGTAMATGAADTVIAGLRDKVTILAGDADRAGHNFNVTMGTALAEAGLDVRLLVLPDGIGDVTDWREADPASFPRNFAVALRGAAPFDPTPPTPPRPARPQQPSFMRTIDGNAQRFVHRADGNFVFCPAMGRMVYEDGVWKVDDLNRATHWMSDMTFEMLAEGDALIEEGNLTGNTLLAESGEALKSFAVRSQNHIFEDSIRRAEKRASVPVSQFDTKRHLLNCRNGTVDLRTSVLRPHDREDWLTHRLDFDYDPDAQAPLWTEKLAEWFPSSPDMPAYLQRVAGYCAVGEVVEHCLFLFVGKGRNGKSVFINAIANVLGPLTGHVPFSTFEKKGPGTSTADLASLRGKRFCVVQEGEAGTTMAESTIKRSTGGDALSCRHLFKSQMSFMPEFAIVMATNSAPRIKGADEGIWSRIRRVDWTRFFTEEERDPWLTQSLAAEAPGILNWIIEGARIWYEGGLGEPEVVKTASRNYRHTSDELLGFVGLVVIEDDEGSINGSDLMGLYLDWAVDENVRPWSRRALYEAVVERVEGVRKVKKSDGVHLTGIRLATNDDRGGDDE